MLRATWAIAHKESRTFHRISWWTYGPQMLRAAQSGTPPFLHKVLFVEKPLSDKAEEMTPHPSAGATCGVGCTTTSW